MADSHTFYFGLSLLNDLTGSYVKPSDNGGRKSKLQSFLDVVLASLAYPIGVFVVMTFWAIYAVDRELVYPKVLDALIPQWLNHAMHTTVLPFLLIEQYVVFHDYPARSKGISILLAFGFAYLCWILWIAYYADLWVYPILQLMETHQRAIFFLVLLAFFITIYILGEVINKALWIMSHQVGAKRRKYDPCIVDIAADAVRNRCMSLGKASEVNTIPKTTLHDRVKRKYASATIEAKTVLSPEGENKIEQWANVKNWLRKNVKRTRSYCKANSR
ncbi:hypothetical protein DPMN_187482 [Dreissena polymorpha]|uniref:HTH psq-type domain-containing protein n=1 Tax=Dreissena polymorpha TaxID=45954 RepID=A0A9D4DP50_DREPO|nr:hypothetical protein DPMN_187482 [Dreissena polymorpha]